MSQVRVCKKNRVTKRNPYVAMVGFEDGSYYRRGYESKGYNYSLSIIRNATKEEAEQIEDSYRIHYFFYKDWVGLVVDELEHHGGVEWAERICNLAYPYQEKRAANLLKEAQDELNRRIEEGESEVQQAVDELDESVDQENQESKE